MRAVRRRLLSAIAETGVKVTGLLRDVHQQAPKAKVLVVGYPQIVSADDACAELPLASGDYAYAEKVNFALTEMLRRAAEATGSTYVDVWSASRGHDICSDDPWINGSVDNEQASRALPPVRERAGRGGRPRGQSDPVSSSFLKPSSSRTGTPSCSAFSALEPGLSPTTT